MTSLPINLSEFERIYPTENDIAFSTYNGVNGSEVNYSKNLHWRKAKNCILPNLNGSGNPTGSAGFEVIAGAGLTVLINRGRAYIEGRYVELNAGSNFLVTVDDNNDTYIYLQLNISGSVQVTPPGYFVTSVATGYNGTHARPSNSVPLVKVRTAGGVVTYLTDLRPSQRNDHIGILEDQSPVGVQYLINVEDNFFNTSFCSQFIGTFTGPADGDTCDITVKVSNDVGGFVTNTIQTVKQTFAPSKLNYAFGGVNIPQSLVGIKGGNLYYVEFTNGIPIWSTVALKDWLCRN